MAENKYRYGQWIWVDESISTNLLSYPSVGVETFMFFKVGLFFRNFGGEEYIGGRQIKMGRPFIISLTPPLGGWEGTMRRTFERERQTRCIRGLRRKARLPIHGQRTKSNGMSARRLGLMGDGCSEKKSYKSQTAETSILLFLSWTAGVL